MRSFFEESRTGIESLVSDQFNKVEKATNKPPKVCLVGNISHVSRKSNADLTMFPRKYFSLVA
jgi:hypothetical protein